MHPFVRRQDRLENVMVSFCLSFLGQPFRKKTCPCALRLADDVGLSTATFNLLFDRFGKGWSSICYLDRVGLVERYSLVI
ncbi:hypothetical protein HY26_12455 [Hyphomonas sp. GM-8P]|nr:hypothetical protein HY26_12455 [Hyphomonas sp. GM-8P]